MTLPKVNEPGWTEKIAVITATQLGNLDLYQSRALDGSAGGTYTPTSPIAIEGEGLAIADLQDSTLNGTLKRTAAGRIPVVVDDSTLLDQVATQVCDMSADIWKIDTGVGHVNSITIHLSKTTGQTPVTGSELEVIRFGEGGAGTTFQIFSEEAPGSVIASFPFGGVINQATPHYSCKFFYTGSTWLPYRATADVTVT